MASLNLEVSNFRAENETVNSQLSVNVPKCMQDLPREEPGHRSLSESEVEAAKSSLLNKNFVHLDFPRLMRTHVDPPIPGQFVGLISFVPSKDAIPDKQGCFGVLKLRGNYDSESRADVGADSIIRNVDSYAVIDYVYVGKPFPLMADNSLYCAETKEIDIRRKLDDITRNDIKIKREREQHEQTEIMERQRKLLSSVEEEAERTYDDLELFVQLNVKRASLLYTRDESMRKLKDVSSLVEKIDKELDTLDKSHPDYKEKYLEKYKSALSSSGIRIEDNPLVKYMVARYPEKKES